MQCLRLLFSSKLSDGFWRCFGFMTVSYAFLMPCLCFPYVALLFCRLRFPFAFGFLVKFSIGPYSLPLPKIGPSKSSFFLLGVVVVVVVVVWMVAVALRVCVSVVVLAGWGEVACLCV